MEAYHDPSDRPPMAADQFEACLAHLQLTARCGSAGELAALIAGLGPDVSAAQMREACRVLGATREQLPDADRHMEGLLRERLGLPPRAAPATPLAIDWERVLWFAHERCLDSERSAPDALKEALIVEKGLVHKINVMRGAQE